MVTGFLGSGKTTFLKRILEKYAPTKKVAIIQNEFAPANMDGAALKREGAQFEILEINNGSVFCVCLLGDFMVSLRQFVDKHQPDMVFLEASGLSDPIAIAQLLDFKDLREVLYLAKVWTVVDAANFHRQQGLMARLQHQVRIADVVIVNKTDVATATQIEQSAQIIADLNPFASIISSTFCDIPERELSMQNLHETVAMKMKEQNAQFEGCGRPDIGVGVFRSSRPVSIDNLRELIDNYAKKTIRIKGFAKLSDDGGMAVQSSFDQTEFKKLAYFHGSTELIVIGEGFDLLEFSRNYKALAG
ncbi:MAG: hypothetical protein HC819_02630 [Cyclobacteriaceae bacterium]|nr:hypothetical protein [Cyclobacteriaceae bacterium]